MLEYYKISNIIIVIYERFKLYNSFYFSFIESSFSGVITNFSVSIISSKLFIYTRW